MTPHDLSKQQQFHDQLVNNLLWLAVNRKSDTHFQYPKSKLYVSKAALSMLPSGIVYSKSTTFGYPRKCRDSPFFSHSRARGPSARTIPREALDMSEIFVQPVNIIHRLNSS